MQGFCIGSNSDSDPHDSYVCNWDRDLSLEWRSVPKMGTVAIWERDANLNLSQWKHVMHNTM